jgi:hypothetical protein
VPISLPVHGSVFVVFRRPAHEKHLVSVAAPAGGMAVQERSDSGVRVRLWRNGRYVMRPSDQRPLTVDVAGIPQSMQLPGPWKVRFAPGRGAPESVVFDELIPWDKHPDERLRHFSGQATYQKKLTLDEEQAEGLVRLQLGDVKCLAQVRVNGMDRGVVWTAPWTVDLTGAARPGENTLEIGVTNLWVNRLIGDAGLPKDQRLTRTSIRLEAGDRTVRPFQGYGSTDPLATSGLLGPVRLEFGRQREVRF